MRLALAGCVIAAASTAHADRALHHTLTFTADMRAHGHDFDEAGESSDLSWLGGTRLTLTFEDPGLAAPAVVGANVDFRLVPELFAGFLADDAHSEGYLGGGVRGEMHIASRRHERVARVVTYVPARAVVIGGHQDPGLETGLGQYFPLPHGYRVGYEVSVMWRQRPDAAPADSHELNGLFSVFIGR